MVRPSQHDTPFRVTRVAKVLTSPVTDQSRVTKANEHGALVELHLTRETRKSRRTTCPNATISTTTVTWKALGKEQGLRDEKTVNNCFAYVQWKLLPAMILYLRREISYGFTNLGNWP